MEFSISPPPSVTLQRDTLEQTLRNKLERTGEILPHTKEEKKLKEATEEFESFFIYLILKEMRKTVPETGLISGGRAEQIFRDMLDEEIGKRIAHTPGAGLGIADMIYRQLTRPVLATPASVAETETGAGM